MKLCFSTLGCADRSLEDIIHSGIILGVYRIMGIELHRTNFIAQCWSKTQSIEVFHRDRSQLCVHRFAL